MSGAEIQLWCGHSVAPENLDRWAGCVDCGKRLRVVVPVRQALSNALQQRRQQIEALRPAGGQAPPELPIKTTRWAGVAQVPFEVWLVNAGVDPRQLKIEVHAEGDLELEVSGEQRLEPEGQISVKGRVRIGDVPVDTIVSGVVVVQWQARQGPTGAPFVEQTRVEVQVRIVEPEWDLECAAPQPLAGDFDLGLVNRGGQDIHIVAITLPPDLVYRSDFQGGAVLVPANGRRPVSLTLSTQAQMNPTEREVTITAEDGQGRRRQLTVSLKPPADTSCTEPIGIDFGMSKSAVCLLPLAGGKVMTFSFGEDLRGQSPPYTVTKLARKETVNGTEEQWGWEVLRMLVRRGPWADGDLEGWRIYEDFKRDLLDAGASDQDNREVVDVASCFLKHLLSRVRAVYGLPEAQGFANVAVTFPAEWNQRANALTRSIMEAAGIRYEVSGKARRVTLTEPEAALISYLDGAPAPPKPGEWVSVFDWGGGTLDLTALQFGTTGPNEPMQQEGLQGRARLGGRDIDRQIAEGFLYPGLQAQVAEFRAQKLGDLARAAVGSRERSIYSRLMAEAEHGLKVRLSETGQTVSGHSVDVGAEPGEITFRCPDFGPEELKLFTREAFAQALDAVDQHCQVLKRKQIELSYMVLTGGSSLFPGLGDAVERMVNRYFGRAQVVRHPNPLLAVALGAARHARGVIEAPPERVVISAGQQTATAIGYLADGAFYTQEFKVVIPARTEIEDGWYSFGAIRRGGGSVLVILCEMAAEGMPTGAPRPSAQWDELARFQVKGFRQESAPVTFEMRLFGGLVSLRAWEHLPNGKKEPLEVEPLQQGEFSRHFVYHEAPAAEQG